MRGFVQNIRNISEYDTSLVLDLDGSAEFLKFEGSWGAARGVSDLVAPRTDAAPASGGHQGRAPTDPAPPPPDGTPGIASDPFAQHVASGGGRTGADDVHRAGGAAHGDAPGAGAPEAVVFDPSVPLTAVPSGSLGVAYGDSFKLHSLPGSTYKIYLDFDGHTTSGTSWNSYWGNSSFYSGAFSQDGSESFNSAELTTIQQVWQRVAEYFSPFNIDVTTEDPGLSGLTMSGTGDATHGIRVVVTGETGKGYGGITWNGSFNWSVDTPAFVYSANLGNNAKYIADAVAHEVGHSLNLNHDGQSGSEYYWGHGGGATSWAPVMGVGYNTSVVQWSNGGYYGATNTEDDLTVITTTNNGVGFRADDVGNGFAGAAALGGTVAGGVASVFSYGIISGSGARNDIDMYWLSVADGGSINLTVTPETKAWVSGLATALYSDLAFSMLDVKLSLYDSAYKLVASFDDPTRQDGVISLSNVTGGTYYLAIDGTGWGTPDATTPSGWSEYGSLGQYAIGGSYTLGGSAPPPPPPPPPALQLSKAALATTEAGGSDSLVVKLLNPAGDVAVSVTGLDATEGALSSSTLLLNAANNWTATLGVTGVNDRDADGTQGYGLTLSASGLASVSVAVSNLDDEVAAVSAGSGVNATSTAKRSGSISKVSATGATLSAIGADDASAMKITEGGSGSSYAAQWRWQFDKLTPGDAILHLDAKSSGEGFHFEYSVDGAATWKLFQGAPANATSWTGDYVASGVGSTLWVRLMDAAPTGDSVRDSFSIDLLTLTPGGAAATAAAIAADYHLG